MTIDSTKDGATGADTTTTDTTIGGADTTTTTDDTTTGGDKGNGGGDGGTVETPEARKARLDRQVEQHKKKHPELYNTDTTTTTTTAPSKTDTFDYGQKAFLAANGIKNADEIKLVQTYVKETGKTLEQVLESKFFQAELKDMQAVAATKAAIPAGTRADGGTTDDIEYWLKQDFKDVPANMRQAVVNARMKKEGNGGQFYNSKK